MRTRIIIVLHWYLHSPLMRRNSPCSGMGVLLYMLFLLYNNHANAEWVHRLVSASLQYHLLDLFGHLIAELTVQGWFIAPSSSRVQLLVQNQMLNDEWIYLCENLTLNHVSLAGMSLTLQYRPCILRVRNSDYVHVNRASTLFKLVGRNVLFL